MESLLSWRKIYSRTRNQNVKSENVFNLKTFLTIFTLFIAPWYLVGEINLLTKYHPKKKIVARDWVGCCPRGWFHPAGLSFWPTVGLFWAPYLTLPVNFHLTPHRCANPARFWPWNSQNICWKSSMLWMLFYRIRDLCTPNDALLIIL